MARRNWFVEQRMEWIAETLRVFGFINREHLERKFGISQPQASLDLTRFQKAHPAAMSYNPSRKCYVAPTGGWRVRHISTQVGELDASTYETARRSNGGA